MVDDVKLPEGGVTPTFQPLQPVNCVSFSGTGMRKKNMRHAFKLNLPRVAAFVPTTKPEVVIIAGGPSLNKHYQEIPQGMDIITCGSVHDHALSLGIKPTYHVECDPALTQINMYKRPSDAHYLVASRCHKTMFNHLKDRKVSLWHMWELDLGKKVYKGEPAMICGATVVLSAVPLAMAMGYKHLHFFGFDSSFETFEENHAYPQHESSAQLTVRVGKADGKEFKTTATWAGQAQQFEDMRKNWPFRCTIYGNGMIAEMERIKHQEAMDNIKAETARIST